LFFYFLESFGQNYPEEADGTLDCISMALTCTFNRWGTLLAVGCNDGRIVIWDFLTRGIAKIISAHIHPVCSLCWSRDGHKLVSASTDNIVSQWDVLTGDCDQRFRFPSPILKLQCHPRDMDKVLVCPMKSAPVLLTLSDSKHVVLPVDDDSDLNVVAAFDRRGEYIYTGNAKGKILVLKTNTQELVASFRVTTGTSNTTAIKSIEFARKGSCFLINTADRIIRVYDGREILTCGRDGEPEPMQKLQDLVNRTPWKRCCFSGDGEYIVAWLGSATRPLHLGEEHRQPALHPGVVSIWAQNQVENWSAFAPDFKELDENVEYEERESEFDIEDEDKSEPEQTACGISVASCSDEELEDYKALLYLPIAPEVEDPEENPFGPPPDASAQTATPEDSLASGDKKQRQPSSEGGPAKKKARTTTVELPGVPSDEVHPLLGVKGDGKSKKKTAGRPKGSKGKDKDFPFRPKPYRGERPAFPMEALGSSGPGGGGGGVGGGMKGRAEGGLATGKHASATCPAAAESGSSASPAAPLV
uniref:Retinoblastoma binding protein 5 n=1 Tax=Labrus bergylta TaxID=56723 RepID=A0A3Q3NJW2_9LABR